MPYAIKQNYKDCDGFAVVKEDDGKIMGCHSSEEKAEDQRKALHASEGDEAKEKDQRKFSDSVYVYIPYDAFTFSDIHEYQKAKERKARIEEVIRYYQALAENILYATEEQIPDKEAALNTLTAELKSELNAADDLKEKKTLATLRKDVLDFIGLSKKEELEVATNPFVLWKDADTDRYHWLAVWSNKYRDDDVPSEIISSDAHRNFVKAVYAGDEPFPELWHFHVEGTRWGKAEWLHYDNETGFMLAAGLVDEGKEAEAEAVAAMEISIGVSHGMPIKSIERDPDDESIITRYVSREISDLPADRAANKLTAFQVMKEAPMSIPDEKRSYLRTAGLEDGKIDEIEEGLKDAASKAELLGLESKEADDELESEAVDAETPEEEIEEETPAEGKSQITREEIAEGINAAIKPVAEAMAKLADAMGEQQKQIETLTTTDEEKIAKKAADTPASSIAALVARSMRAVGDDAVKVGDEEVVGPKETPTNKSGSTGIKFIDELIAGE